MGSTTGAISGGRMRKHDGNQRTNQADFGLVEQICRSYAPRVVFNQLGLVFNELVHQKHARESQKKTHRPIILETLQWFLPKGF